MRTSAASSIEKGYGVNECDSNQNEPSQDLQINQDDITSRLKSALFKENLELDEILESELELICKNHQKKGWESKGKLENMNTSDFVTDVNGDESY